MFLPTIAPERGWLCTGGPVDEDGECPETAVVTVGMPDGDWEGYAVCERHLLDPTAVLS